MVQDYILSFNNFMDRKKKVWEFHQKFQEMPKIRLWALDVWHTGKKQGQTLCIEY